MSLEKSVDIDMEYIEEKIEKPKSDIVRGETPGNSEKEKEIEGKMSTNEHNLKSNMEETICLIDDMMNEGTSSKFYEKMCIDEKENLLQFQFMGKRDLFNDRYSNIKGVNKRRHKRGSKGKMH